MVIVGYCKVTSNRLKDDPRNFFFIKKFYLGAANLMIHNQMSHNKAKNWVLSLIYRAAIDFRKSKTKIESTGPFFQIFFKEQKTKLTEHIKSIFLFSFFT